MFKKMLLGALFVAAACCLAQAADFSKLPDINKGMKKGQWVKHKTMGVEIKQTIVDITGEGDNRQLTMRMEQMHDGQVVNSNEQTINMAEAEKMQQDAREANPDVKIYDEKVTVNGRTYNAVVMEGETMGITTKTYISEEVPVTGIVKIEMPGQGAVMEVVDFGQE